MKLSSIDKISNERCMLLVEDLETGDVQKIYNKESITNYKKIYDSENYIIIKNPTQEQRKKILKELIQSGDGDITKAKLSNLDLMLIIAPIITTLSFNPKKKADIKKLDMLLKPDNMPQIIKELETELGKILTNIINEWIEYAQSISELPEYQQDILLNNMEQNALEKQLEEETNKLETMKEVVDNADI